MHKLCTAGLQRWTDLSEVEIICLYTDLFSFLDLYFRTWSLCGVGIGCGIGPWCKEGENLKKNSQQFVFDCKERDNPKKILNKLFFSAKKGATSKWVPTSCFWLQRKGQPQKDSQQVAFYCSPEMLVSERDAGSETMWPCGLTISDNWRGKKKVRRFETRRVRHGCWTV